MADAVIPDGSAGVPAGMSAFCSPPRLIGPLARPILCGCPEYQRALAAPARPGALAEFALATPGQPHDPIDLFNRLRWGGVFIYAGEQETEVAELAALFARNGFALERGPTFVRDRVLGLRLPGIGRKVHYFLARKVLLIPPGATTDRFTYQVQLVRQPDPNEPLAVLKEVPSEESVIARLHAKFPDVGLDTIERRARKFTERIFPTFLTRETAILMILQEHLPNPYHRRVPRVIDFEKDERGLVRKLRMSWLRNGGAPLSHVEFAHQSADLLRALHDIARVVHLDLRLDNFVITPEGVGFVDFGSAIRDNEDLHQNPMVGALFEELMRTSQIQHMLNQMMVSGHLTSDIICRSHQKADKAIDFFYLAVQFNSPHTNPDLVDLIQYDPRSEDARHLAHLTAQILRPPDPANPPFRSAKDILHGIERMQLGLDARPS